MTKKLTNEIFIERATTKHEYKYLYSLVEYQNSKSKIKIICPKHGVFEQLPTDHLNGSGCTKCRDENTGNILRSTKEEFIKNAVSVHGVLYDYSLVNYINNKTKIKIICPIEGHGLFEQIPADHLSGRGCSCCGGSEKLTTDDFIKRAKKIHGDLYDYSLVEYTGAINKVKIICRKEGHGIFEQSPVTGHLRGQGCPKCVGLNKSTDDFIKESIKKHGNLYDYSLIEYTGAINKVKIICRKEGHGIFEQEPHNHLRGAGCPKCVGLNKSTDDFIEELIKIHGDKYDYSLVDYINNKTKIKIICKKKGHGEFEQIPNHHLHGHGCPKCSSSISLLEIIWLNLNNVQPQYRQYKLLGYNVDGYDPNTNTIYEFHGDFWHGNPSKFSFNEVNPRTKTTFGYLYSQTIKKEQKIKNAGYNLVVIWESNFEQQYKQQIKNYKSIHGNQKVVECKNY